MFILSLFVIRRNLGTVLVYCFYVSCPLMILPSVSYNQGGCKMVTFCILSACISWHSVRAGFPLSPTCSFVYLCYGLSRFLKILWYYLFWDSCLRFGQLGAHIFSSSRVPTLWAGCFCLTQDVPGLSYS